MFQAQLPIYFWGECVSTTAYIINRTPSLNLQNQSPYKLLYGKIPAYDLMKVFGCLCYAATVPAQRHKFTPRATKCVFLGYPFGYKGYKLYDLDNHKFLISRDVTFQENSIPFATSTYTASDPFPNFVVPRPLPDMLPDPNPTPQPPPKPKPQLEIEPNLAQPDVQPNAHVRRSTRVTRPPTHLHNYVFNVTYPIHNHLMYDNLSPTYRDYVFKVSEIYEPQFYHQAVRFPKWHQAMNEEIQALEMNNTWVVQPLPPGKRTIGCRWLYKVKYRADDSLDRYKARLVVKGYTQQAGIDFLDTFSPVAKLTTVNASFHCSSQKLEHVTT